MSHNKPNPAHNVQHICRAEFSSHPRVCPVWGEEVGGKEDTISDGWSTTGTPGLEARFSENKNVYAVEENGAITDSHESGSLVEKPKESGAKHLYCTKCDYTSTKQWNLSRHNTNVHENTVCICNSCGLQLKNRSSLRSHMLNKHENEGLSFPCGECGKLFKIAWKFCKYHDGRNDKIVPCSKGCGYFGKSSYVKSHQKTSRCNPMNLMVKLFKCDVCDNKFTTEKYKIKHEKNHSEGRRYKCYLCEQGFTESFNLTKHLNKKTCLLQK